MVGPEIVPPRVVVQRYVKFGPLLLPAPLSATVFMVQVSWVGGAIRDVGKAVFCVITTEPELVQELAGLVTVRVYVPGWSTLGFQEFCPETMLPPPLATQTGKSVGSEGGIAGPMLKFVVAQVSVLGLPAGAGGGTMLEVTVTVAEEVQPVVILVIWRV